VIAVKAKSEHGIPRLQELGFLLTAASEVARGGTYEDVRHALIRTKAQLVGDTAPTGNTAARRQGTEKAGHYVDNATGALAELMRIELLDRAPLPSTANAAKAYTETRFLLTDEGVMWLELLEEQGEPAALDALLRRLWKVHPQLRDYLRLLNAVDAFLVPALPWSTVFPHGSGPEGRDVYVDALVAHVLESGDTPHRGWSATPDEVRQAITAYTGRREAFAAKRGRPPYKRSRDFVAACDEAVTVLALHKAGVAVDYISFEILRRWTQDLLIANFSYWVPRPPSGLRAWSTATLTELDGAPEFARRPPGDNWVEPVQELLPEAFAAAVRQEGGSSFASVWRVRAFVCASLHINDAAFDGALRELQRRARRGEVPFDLAFEVSTTGAIPPTERPFRGINDRYGREPVFSLINVRRRQEGVRHDR